MRRFEHRLVPAMKSGAAGRVTVERRVVALGLVAPSLFVLSLLGSASGAAAQPSGTDDPDALLTGRESPELAALRALEHELFGGQALAVVPDPAGRVRISDGAAAVTSDAPRVGAIAGETPSRDLSWLRGLTLPDIPVRWDARVIRYLEFFREDPRGQRHIRSWLRRVDRYGPTIRETLRRQGLPRDLIFVAMVESGFDPTARSHAGAAGMWQFVERTGEELDLPVSHWVDARLDPERATVAAGRYLEMLHDRFGTWELAFAGYNMGYGALLRSIRKYNTNDYWELAHLESGLPYETNLYVAKIVACAIVAHNRERFGLTDLEIEAPLAWETVEVPGGVQLAAVARAAGTDAATLRELNPSLRRGRTPPGAEPFRVHIPAGTSARFSERWARVRATRPVHQPRMIRFGETLADLARSTGATEPQLRELNGIEEQEIVGAGTTLLVPVGQRRGREPEPEAPVVAVPAGPRAIPGRRRVFYRVVRGDDASEVARFFRVRPDELRRWNGIDPDATLQAGMFLQLFVPPSVDLSRALVLTPDEVRVLVVGSEEFFAYHEDQAGRVRFRYRVREGDTLGHIGQRFGLRAASLARINQIAQSSTLHPGDELIVYAEPSRVPAGVRRENEAEAARETAATEPTLVSAGLRAAPARPAGDDIAADDAATADGSATDDAAADAAATDSPADDRDVDPAADAGERERVRQSPDTAPVAPVPPDDPSEVHPS